MDLNKVYSLRQKFTILAITGRTGSGCSEITQQLRKGFEKNESIFPIPEEVGFNHNSYRKYRIVYNYAVPNFKGFQTILYKDVLVAFVLKYGFDDFISFLQSDLLKKEFFDSKLTVKPDFREEIIELNSIKTDFVNLHKEAQKLISESKKSDDVLKELYSFFYSKEFLFVNETIHSVLKSNSLIKRNKTLQVISNNLRNFGHPYQGSKSDTKNIFTIAEVINDLIKAIKNSQGDGNTEIVIDSLRNPFEIMFFKQRYGAFYTLAIHRGDKERLNVLKTRYKPEEFDDIKVLLEEEYLGGKTKEFFKLNVSQCLQNADIHINYKELAEALIENKLIIDNKDNTSPYYSWGMQLLKYVALIDHPGIITPSPEERCMQLAYTAKYNSGCLSRQVGASITDENYAIKAIGWNNTPEGHVPCSLRNIEDLLSMRGDLDAFTPFEKENQEFRRVIMSNYQDPIIKNKVNLNGLNVSFCFKTLINSYLDGKNQVHTRSLHAEESAFLQITKYGGVGIKNGKLFTTASPCELCSKKAYQLGIKVIYYIDPYPGISQNQILKAGKEERNPQIRLFDGAIGSAYHWLYEPFMSFKDELALILDLNIKHLADNYKDLNAKLQQDKNDLERENVELKKEIEALKMKYEQ